LQRITTTEKVEDHEQQKGRRKEDGTAETHSIALSTAPARIRKETTPRSDLEIIAAIIQASSHNGGELASHIKRIARITNPQFRSYMRILLEHGFIEEEILEDEGFARIFKPTALGYEFLLKHKELLSMIDREEPQLLNLWE
jgi:predicted transcriptional regulator